MYDDGSGEADRDAFPSYPWGSDERELAFMAGPGHPQAVLRLVAAHRAVIEKYRTAQTTVEVAGGTVLSGAMKVSMRAYGEVLKVLAAGWGISEGEG